MGTAPNGYRPWGLVGPERAPRLLYAAHRREMSPVTLEKVSYQAGGQGQHQLVIRVKVRNDFPAYAIKKYVLKTNEKTVVIPDLQPGQSMEVKVPVRGFEKNVTLEVMKPTGFSVITETFELK